MVTRIIPPLKPERLERVALKATLAVDRVLVEGALGENISPRTAPPGKEKTKEGGCSLTPMVPWSPPPDVLGQSNH